jgi:hypothetical protein
MTERIGSAAWVPPQTPESTGRSEEDVSSSSGPRPLAWYGERAAVDATCLALPCDLALGVAKLVMPDRGLAEEMLDHFRAGATEPVGVDLDRELERNPFLKELLASRIESELAARLTPSADTTQGSGAIWLSQSDYGSSEAAEDQRLALGGTFIEYAVVGSAGAGGLEVELNVSDYYFWSPSDASRVTQCLHECAADMVVEGEATEFYQFGEGSLVVADPRSSATTPSPAIQAAERR